MALSKGKRLASKGTCVVYFLCLRSGGLYIGASEILNNDLTTIAQAKPSGQHSSIHRFRF